MSEDIAPILREWDEDPDEGNVRMIIGTDGREKIQLRVQFGLLQMEADGRPDGKRPYGKESLLEHFYSLLDTYKEEYGTDDGFEVYHHDCENLHEEALQYYHRYVSLFEIEDYERAERDTARNLQVIDFIKQYAESQDDIFSIEKYRPYITMMNARANAFILMDEDDYAEATAFINDAIAEITEFYKENDISEREIQESQELAILKELAKEVRDKWEGK